MRHITFVCYYVTFDNYGVVEEGIKKVKVTKPGNIEGHSDLEGPNVV